MEPILICEGGGFCGAPVLARRLEFDGAAERSTLDQLRQHVEQLFVARGDHEEQLRALKGQVRESGDALVRVTAFLQREMREMEELATAVSLCTGAAQGFERLRQEVTHDLRSLMEDATEQRAVVRAELDVLARRCWHCEARTCGVESSFAQLRVEALDTCRALQPDQLPEGARPAVSDFMAKFLDFAEKVQAQEQRINDGISELQASVHESHRQQAQQKRGLDEVRAAVSECTSSLAQAFDNMAELQRLCARVKEVGKLGSSAGRAASPPGAHWPWLGAPFAPHRTPTCSPPASYRDSHAEAHSGQEASRPSAPKIPRSGSPDVGLADASPANSGVDCSDARLDEVRQRIECIRNLVPAMGLATRAPSGQPSPPCTPPAALRPPTSAGMKDELLELTDLVHAFHASLAPGGPEEAAPQRDDMPGLAGAVASPGLAAAPFVSEGAHARAREPAPRVGHVQPEQAGCLPKAAAPAVSTSRSWVRDASPLNAMSSQAVPQRGPPRVPGQGQWNARSSLVKLLATAECRARSVGAAAPPSTQAPDVGTSPAASLSPAAFRDLSPFAKDRDSLVTTRAAPLRRP